MYDDMDVGYRITAVALGIDAFERKEQQGTGSLDTEGLIPIYLGGDMVAPASTPAGKRCRTIWMP